MKSLKLQKGLIYLALILTCSFVLPISCKDKDNHTDNPPIPQTGLRIKGTITGRLNKKGTSLAEAKKIIVFKGLKLWDGVGGTELVYEMVDIIDSSFTINANLGNAVAMIFLDSKNKYIGTFSSNGLSILPMLNLSGGDTTTINLSYLRLEGSRVLSNDNPFNKNINLSAEEIEILKEIDNYFEFMSKNLDTDKDGIIDFSVDQQIYIKSQYNIEPGIFRKDGIEPIISSDALNSIQTYTQFYGGKGFNTPNKIIFKSLDNQTEDSFHFQPNPVGKGFNFNTGPLNGNYTLEFNSKTHTIAFKNTDAKLNLVYVIPILITNNEGKLEKIRLSYKNSRFQEINPENCLTEVIIQLEGGGRFIFNSPWLKSKYSQHQGPNQLGLNEYKFDQPIDIKDLERIYLVYNDLLGNIYFSTWRDK
jgi:hypothetical protein